MEQSSARCHIGTCSWSFDEWKGAFYPEHLPRREWLHWYAAHFTAVEADSTFYGLPAPGVLSHWAAVTPPGFRFCVKAPKAVTHSNASERDPGAFTGFLRAVEALGDRLGCVLLQYPPWFRSEAHFADISRFIDELPSGFRYAVEFRDRSWEGRRTDEKLAERGVARVWADAGPVGECGACLHRPRTASHVYLRLMGDPATKYDEAGTCRHRYTRLMWDREVEIEAWVQRIKAEVGLEEVFLLANNHYEGFAPATARRMAKALGIRLPEPPADPPPPIQGELSLQ